MKKVDNAKIQKIASVFRDFLCFCVTKIKKWKNTSRCCCAAVTHKNWGVWRGVEIAFHGCRRVFKRGDSGWNCPCCFLLLYKFRGWPPRGGPHSFKSDIFHANHRFFKRTYRFISNQAFLTKLINFSWTTTIFHSILNKYAIICTPRTRKTWILY